MESENHFLANDQSGMYCVGKQFASQLNKICYCNGCKLIDWIKLELKSELELESDDGC